MSTPGEYYRSLPPVCKAYGVFCLMASTACYLELYDPWERISLSYELVLKRFQLWRLVTNFFFLGPFSFPFAIRLIMIARYGVLLEKGPFDKRTADFVWMMIFGALALLIIAAIPMLSAPFLAVSLVFMLVYVWSREFPNAQISIYGVVTLKNLLLYEETIHRNNESPVPLTWTHLRSPDAREFLYSILFLLLIAGYLEFESVSSQFFHKSNPGFYLPWAMLALDLIFGAPLKPDIIGMITGHLYYFLTVLYPLSTGTNIFKTPLCVHKLVVFWGKGTQINSPVQPDPSVGVAFRGRGYRLGNR